MCIQKGHVCPHLSKIYLNIERWRWPLFSNYTEEIKRFAIGTVLATDILRSGCVEERTVSQEPKPGGTKRPHYQKELKFFEENGLLSKVERDEIGQLCNYRNEIAHRIHELTADISRTKFNRDFAGFLRQAKGRQYSYDALVRLRHYRELLPYRAATSGYATTLDLSSVLFQSAEQTFETELKRLHRKIERQLVERKRRNAELQIELSLDGTGLTGNYQPDHPANRDRVGRLTKRGAEICYRLYDHERSPIAVAHLMGLSLNAAEYRKKKWLASGGRNRNHAPLETFE